MEEYLFTTEDGNTYKATGAEILFNGISVGWVSVDVVLAWESGKLTDAEVRSIARRNPYPPNGDVCCRFESVTIL